MIDPTTSLSDALRDHTAQLHREAEETGVMSTLMRGTASREQYGLLLRNLLPVYSALETVLSTCAPSDVLAPLARPELYRAVAIADDLNHLFGPTWQDRFPLLPAGVRYQARIGAVARGERVRLVAHAYTRYLGDLSGGQILRQRLARSFGRDAEAMSFLSFPRIIDPQEFKARYRATLDAAVIGAVERRHVLEEARLAFRLNIDLSIEIATEVNPQKALPAATG